MFSAEDVFSILSVEAPWESHTVSATFLVLECKIGDAVFCGRAGKEVLFLISGTRGTKESQWECIAE